MARLSIEKRGLKTYTSKTTSRVAKPTVPRVTRSKALRHRVAIASTQHNGNSPFLRLPAEIRNQIYDYVIGGQTYVIHERSRIKQSYYLTRKDGIDCHWREQTTLSRTCRQFRHETSVLFFQNNMFMASYFGSFFVTKGWMHSLQPYHANAVQTILWGFGKSDSARKALRSLLADWVRIKRVGLYYYSNPVHRVAYQEGLTTAGFELDDTVEDVRFGRRLIMWYERS